MAKFISFILILHTLIILSCSSRNSNYSEDENYDESSNSENSDSEEVDEDEEIENGTHSATVDYYNPKTGYSHTYNLDVEVEDGEVNQINFPKGGYLDNSHINSGTLEDGNTTVEDDKGRSYDITIDD